ncbi:MAG: MG2 domain-containing protein, partial [Armatimonadetes bacterium]|nr:MG2 domain-containing protein [Armatimonadota bacterium]
MVLVAKKSPKRLLVFAADAQTGKPISGCFVKLFDEKGKLVSQGRTNEKGLLLTNYMLEHVVIIATSPDGSTVEMPVWSETQERFTVYIFTDRPVYRPNQRVYFKGIVRKFENGEYEPVTNKQVQVIVRNPEDTEIAKLTLRTNRFGSFAGEVELPEKASLGR